MGKQNKVLKKDSKQSDKTFKNQRSKWRSKAKSEASKDNYQDAFADDERSKGLKYPLVKPKFSKASNDPQWYFKSPDLLRDVASFSYSTPLGTPINDKGNMPPDVKVSAWNTIAGVMAVSLVPSIGVSLNASSPVNLGAQNIYTRVRYKNSGAANYDAPDLMLYYIAMSSVYSAWNWAKRIYGYASTYSATNKYKPAAYAKLENVNLDEVVSNLANYRFQLNTLADQISAFCVPSVFTYMVRQSWLYSNIYKDSNTQKAQEYLYTPACFYKYDETSSQNGGLLVPVDISLTDKTTPYTSTMIITTLKSMIDALQYSSDIGNMSGDTLKEFGNELYVLSHFDADYKIDAVYDPEVLMQIENTNYWPYWDLSQIEPDSISNKTKVSTFNITQDPNTNWIKWQPSAMSAGTDTHTTGYYINFHNANPTPEQVIVATRLNYMETAVNLETPYRQHTVVTCGSELAIRVEAVIFATNSEIAVEYTNPTELKLVKWRFGSQIVFGPSTYENPTVDKYQGIMETNAKSLMIWNSFDWAPPIYAVIQKKDSSLFILPDFRDWDVNTFIPTQAVESMNLLALLSEFNVPN